MSQQCLLIEDDPLMAEQVTDILKERFRDLELLPTASDIDAARQAINSLNPDLVISDINLGDEVVFSLFKELGEIHFKIIFITAYSKYAVEAFRFSALDFLQKPFEDEQLVDAVNSALEAINIASYNKQLQTFFHNFNPETKKKKLALKTLEAVHIVEISEILYIKSDNNYSEFHLADGGKILVSKPLKLYDEQLRNQAFFRSHQSYLVNLDYAKTFHKQDSVLELTSGEHIAVSGAKSGALIHKISELM